MLSLCCSSADMRDVLAAAAATGAGTRAFALTSSHILGAWPTVCFTGKVDGH